jgi:hypothetical protein
MSESGNSDFVAFQDIQKNILEVGSGDRVVYT